MTWTRERRIATFLSHVEKHDSGCWLWTGARKKDGYGWYSRLFGPTAHRAAYMLWVGKIPEGLELDHLCRVRHCVNPEHLEAVTHAENIRRRYVDYDECVNGHAYDEGNTYWRPGTQQRDCRACIRERARRYKARRANAA